MIDDELQGWIEKSLNECASEAESQALEERLLTDPQALDHYLNAVALHAALRRRFSNDAPTTIAMPSRSRRGLVLAIAASLALVGSIFALLQSRPTPTAVVAQVVGAYHDDGAFAAGESVGPGPLQVARGLLRLDFANGARLTVEGPAELELTNENRVVLHRGVVTATIPESAVGFVVDTPAAHVLDLGTSFGVSVSEAGLTDVCVFDGEVEVSVPTGAPQLVREGQAVRTGEGAIEAVDYETAAFEKSWPVNLGVLQTTGSMRFVKPGPNFHPGNYEDNEHIVVFPERQGFTVAEATRVDMVDPGEYARSKYHDKPMLAAGTRLTSYLLQLNAYPEGKNPNRRRSVRGQITFAKPIVGVITMNRLLNESELVFGIPNVEYPSPRAIEPRPEGDQRPGFDSLILAADQRTLLIELRENPGHIDQVRVLVEAE